MPLDGNPNDLLYDIQEDLLDGTPDDILDGLLEDLPADILDKFQGGVRLPV